MTSNSIDGNTIIEVLDDTQDYQLVLGVFPLVEHMNGRRAYGVLNKVYGTLEAVGPVYPLALTTLYNLQHDLDNARVAVKAIQDGEATFVQDDGEDDEPYGFH